MSIQETLRRIQEEAARKTAETVAKYGPAVSPSPAKVAAADLKLLRDEVSGALAKAICARVSRNFVGDLVDNIHNVATDKIQRLKDYSFDRHANRTADGQITLFPKNCRFFVQNENGHGTIIVEDEPQPRVIFTGRNETVRIALPYLVFVIQFQEIKGRFFAAQCGIGFRPKPLVSIDDTIYVPMLPHCDINGNCQPIDGLPPNGCGSVVEVVNAFLNSFWNSSFVYAFRAFTVKGAKIKNFSDWETKIKNPLDILKADFQDGGYTIRSFMDRYDDGRARTIVGNQVERHLHGVVNAITGSINADDLTNIIHAATEQVVNTVLQNAFPESALQSK